MHDNPPLGGGGGRYIGYRGLCGPKGYGFSAVLADFGHFGHIKKKDQAQRLEIRSWPGKSSRAA